MKAFLAVMVVVAVLEFAYRWAGAVPSVIPGWTKTEFEWRMQHTDVAHAVVVIGDSRVGWGFAEKPFERAIRARGAQFSSLQAVNAGLAATSMEAILRYVTTDTRRDTAGGWLVLNFSSAAFYCFGDGFLDNRSSQVTLQDYADDQIRMAVQSCLLAWEQDPRRIAALIRERLKGRIADEVYYLHRVVYPDGFVEAQLGSAQGRAVDARAYELDNYSRILQTTIYQPSLARIRLQRIRQYVDTARRHGWSVALVRFPISSEMRALEAKLPRDLQFRGVAAFLGLQSKDYNEDPRTRSLATSDGSHLTGESAHSFSIVLVDDVAAWMGNNK